MTCRRPKLLFRSPKSTSPAWAAGGRKDVLFVFDQPGAWTRYRSDHQAEALRFAGLACDLVQADTVDLLDAVGHYDRFVLNRVEWTDDLAVFCDRARAAGATLIFDTDDLVFEPELIHHFAVFDGWPESELLLEVAKLDRYRRTLDACDGATVTTEPLREHALRHAENVDVVPNAVSEDMVRHADDALARVAGTGGDAVTIGYLSGTRTHARDFLEAADAVLWALATYPHVRFQAVGKLHLDERFDRFAGRVERMPLRPWQALPTLLRGIDINLAPLERANPVTECKSCVKYLEAALGGVPTVASPRPDFVRVIDNGLNGLLAESPGEWRDALGRLIESSSERREVGERAAEETRREHTTMARAAQAAGVFRDA
jgi:glycosyltransferase involved in cell wall biosynthesis